MNSTIEQYTRGNITLELPEIILSETEIEISVEAGKTYSGSIIITNDKKRQMKGVAFSSNRHIKLKEEQFVGTEVILHYTVDADKDVSYDSIESEITIVSDCGEYVIPVHVKVTAASLKAGDLAIKNLFQFVDLAKEDLAQAVTLFASEHFPEVLMASEPSRYQEIYQNLLKGRSASGALEEFLIAIHKKQPINLSVSCLAFTYDSIKEPLRDEILITKDLWGYIEIEVSTDAEFIELEQKLLCTDDFVGNQCSLGFGINPEYLREGRNFGHIYLETLNQRFVVEVVCTQRDEEHVKKQQEHKRLQQYYSDLHENYLNFRLKRLEFEEYVTKSEAIIEQVMQIQPDEMLKLLGCHLDMMKGNRLEAKQVLDRYEHKLPELKETNAVVFCTVYYLKALVYQEEAMIQNACDIIRGMYQLGHTDFIIFWFLIYMDKSYINNKRQLLEDLKMQYEEGCRSPIMYFEALNVIQADPALLQELDAFEQQIINFGVKRGSLSEDVARQYAYLAGKERYYNKLIFHSLEQMYALYPEKDILTAICSTLIKGHQRSPRDFKWYKLGVESQLRVTELHEYYMYTIDERSTDPLPQSILLYFIYNSRLNDKKRAYLYARIVRDKAGNPSIYRTYAKKIEQFALRQLLNENLNDNLAILYENLVEEDQVTPEAAKCLAKLAYRRQIVCKNPKITGVYVVQKELEKEEYLTFNDHSVYVDVLTEDAVYYFTDQKQQRYVTSVEYEEKQLLKVTDKLQELLYQTDMNLYQYVDRLAAEGAYQSYDEATVQLCRQAMELPDLNGKYRNELAKQLIYYYNSRHESEILNEYLVGIDLKELDRKSRCSMLEILIQQEQYEMVLEEIRTFGYEELNGSHLSHFCVVLIHQEEECLPKEMLQDMCLCAFINGSRQPEILDYLVKHYVGPTAMMVQILKAAKASQIAAHNMEEQVLAQVLFSQGDIGKVLEHFISFYQYAPKSNVSHAYLNYASTLYLMNDICPALNLLGCMKHEFLERRNIFCALALLKYFSNHLEEVIDEEKSFVADLLEEAVLQEAVLPEFVRLGEKIAIPNVMRNKTWISYRSQTKNPVKLYYRVLSDTDKMEVPYTSEMLTPAILGFYVRSVILFYQETLEYYFEEEINGEKVQSEVFRAEYQPEEIKYQSTFEQLNEMIRLYETKEDNGDHLADLIESYVKKEYIIQHYFRVL